MSAAPATPGRFITFEGGEGVGKSTQIALLAAALERSGIRVRATREPGGVESAERIRRLLVEGAVDAWRPMTEALLHTAARVEHVEKLIRPALAAGEWVLCDRFADSTVAYQGYGHGLGAERMRRLQVEALGPFRADLTLVLDMPVAAGLARTGARRGDETRYERMDRAFHERVRQGFVEIAAGDPTRFVVLDAEHHPERVAEAILRAVAGHFGLARRP
jgi:dTMP kinase